MFVCFGDGGVVQRLFNFSLAPPRTNLSISERTTDSLSLDWTDPDVHVSWTYKLEYQPSPNIENTEPISVPLVSASRKISDLSAGVGYELSFVTTSYDIDGDPYTIIVHTS